MCIFRLLLSAAAYAPKTFNIRNQYNDQTECIKIGDIIMPVDNKINNVIEMICSTHN